MIDTTNRVQIKNILLNPDQWGSASGSGPNAKVTDTRDAYARVPLVFRATRIRCNSLLKIPHHLVTLNGDGETEVEYPFGDLDALLWQTQAALLLRGGSFLLKQRNTVRTVGAQWLNPFTVNVTWNSTLNRREFSQDINGRRYPAQGAWTDEDIVFIREFGLTDDIGVGVASAAVGLTDAQLKHYLKTMAATFFEAGAMPITVLSTVNGFADKDEAKRVESFFKRALTGVRNFGRVLAVQGDTKITTTQSPFKDLAVPDLSDEARKDIARAFELPVTLLDSDETFATAKEHRRQYYDDTVIPAAKLIVGALNKQHLEPLGLHLELAPEEMDIYQESEAERAAALQAITAALISAAPNVVEGAMIILGYDIPDEARRLIFQVKPPAPTTPAPTEQPIDADVMPEDAQAKSIESAQFRRWAQKRIKAQKLDNSFLWKYHTEEEGEALRDIVLQEHIDAEKKTIDYGSPAHKARMTQFEDRTAKHERKVAALVTALFEKQSKALAGMAATKAGGKDIGDPQAWHQEFIDGITPLLEEVVADAADKSIADYALGISFDLTDPRVNEFISTRAQRFAEEVNATTWDELKKTMQEATDAGESIGKIAERIAAVMGDRIRSSAETIARTEVISSYNAGTMASWEQSGVVSKKTWLAALDKRTRDAHANAHGQTVALDEAFRVDGESLQYPGDSNGSAGNVINCRCTVTAVLD